MKLNVTRFYLIRFFHCYLIELDDLWTAKLCQVVKILCLVLSMQYFELHMSLWLVCSFQLWRYCLAGTMSKSYGLAVKTLPLLEEVKQREQDIPEGRSRWVIQSDRLESRPSRL